MKVTYDPPTRIEPAPSLFSPGAAWQRAAEEWAADMGMKIAAWQVDQRFAADGMKFRIEWNDNAECWEVLPEAMVGSDGERAIDAELMG